MAQRFVDILSGADRGSPDNPLPNGLLILAQAGRDVWNDWRAAFPTMKDASGNWQRTVRWRDQNAGQDVRLSNFGEIGFAGFVFGDGADFSNMEFSRQWRPRFDGAVFGADTNFNQAQFQAGASFDKAQFGARAMFLGTVFSQYQSPGNRPWVTFDGATFGDDANLSVLFHWVVAGPPEEVSFKDCCFGDRARVRVSTQHADGHFNFAGKSFGADANFEYSDFSNKVIFADRHFGIRASFNKTKIRQADFRRAVFLGDCDFRGEEFGLVDFREAQFGGAADFSNRHFLARTQFGAAKFVKAPLFHNAELHQDTEFHDESFPARAEGTGEASRAYRTLKLAMSKHQATREEQFFFRLEMREEQRELWRSESLQKRLRAVLYSLYSVFSGYGASVLRPGLWLIASWLIGAAIYASLSGAESLWHPGRDVDWPQTFRWLTFSVANSVPLGGIDELSRDLRHDLFKLQRFDSLPLVLMAHKLVTLVLVFLIGLALRNMFKMK